MINALTRVSAIDKFAMTTLAQAIPGLCIGADIDDAWLLARRLARISSADDYVVNETTQTLASIAPLYDQARNLWHVYAVSPLPLADAARAKCAKVDALFDAKMADGAHWNGIKFQIDAISQTKFAGAGAYAIAVVNNVPNSLAWPTGFFWIASDNTHVPMTAAQCLSFTQTMGATITSLVLACRGIKDACLAATDLASLNAIDITQNWPAV